MQPLTLILVGFLLLCGVDGFTLTTVGNGRTVGKHKFREFQLFSTPPRQPRRMLKKRRSRERSGRSIPSGKDDSFPWDTAESRPLIKERKVETGEDYWIDEEELKAEEARIQAIRNRKAMEGEIPKEKLWSEVKAPYKQNWIGYFSIMIMIISAIIIKFPELLDQPIVQIPDL